MQLREYFEKHNQGHVFKYWDELGEAEKSALEAQLKQLEPEQIAAVIGVAGVAKTHFAHENERMEHSLHAIAHDLNNPEPPSS